MNNTLSNTSTLSPLSNLTRPAQLSENTQTETWEKALKTFQSNLSQTSKNGGQEGNSPLFIKNQTSAPLPATITENLSEKETFIAQKKHALLKAAQSFEALLVYQMFKAMEKNLEGDKLIGENQATKIFKDFLTSENSLLAVKSGSGSLGLAKLIYEENVKHIF